MEAVHEEERAARDTLPERVISSARRVIVSNLVDLDYR